MLTLFLSDGNPVPATFNVDQRYTLRVSSDGGLTITSLRWTLARRAEGLSQGEGDLVFEPRAASVYYLNVVAVKSNGTEEEALYMLVSVAPGAPRLNASIRWSSRLPKFYEKLSAVIDLDGPEPVQSITWTCFFNNVPVLSGTGPQVAFGALQPGVYRVQALIVDASGGDTLADSSITIPGATPLTASIVPTQPEPTLQFLGEVYSPQLISSELYCTYLPYELTAISAIAYLVPGTQYFQLEAEGVVDDEVVVRTQTGNWTLIGPPAGLTAETLPYDYQHGQPYLPAPLDLKLRYTVDSWNVHGLVATAQNFRVKFKCYRQAPALYRYTPCDWSAYPGGEGERQRRLVAVVTQADVESDADLHRTRSGVLSYTLPALSELRSRLETTRGSDQVFQDDRFFTQQTVACHYEAATADTPDLTVNAIYGLAGVRPSYLDFGQKGYPRIVHKVKRLYGKLLVFVAGGGFAANTSIVVRVSTGAASNYQQYTVPVTKSVYAQDYDQYLKVGEADIDLSDFEFGRLGLVFDFTVDETAATATVPRYFPLPRPAEPALYSTVNAPAIQYEGACFSNPTSVAAFAGTWAASGTSVVGCAQIECGPAALYCYTALDNSGTTVISQPLGFPAPYIALQSDQARCYGTPAFIAEVLDNTGLTPVFTYTSDTACGVGYLYTACDASVSLAVIYPTAASPHSFVFYGSLCYSYVGSATDLRPYPAVAVSAVTAVVDCQDYLCTGSNVAGPSVVYQDAASTTQVNVSFPHLDLGVPLFGAILAASDPGYDSTPPGLVRCAVTRSRFVFDLFTAQETATIKVRVDEPRYARQIIVVRGAVKTTYQMQPGLPEIFCNVQTGDQVRVAMVGLHQMSRSGQVQVRYEKVVSLPRLYHTAVVPQADNSVIRAVGFCDVSSRSDYNFLGTLPAIIEQVSCNPDSRLTVQGTNTQEMVLVESRAYGESRAYTSLPSYAGQSISGPITFRFYADRDRAGQHGEMDLWLEADQPFPAYLQASPYQVLAYGTYSYRRDAQQGDASRRGLRVAASTTGIQYPRIHASAEGERIAVMTSSGTIYHNNVPFVYTGTLDMGLSENVVWA